MAYTAPRTWVTNELVTAALMNTHVRDNLIALKTPPSDQYTGELTDGTSSPTWADIDSTNLSLTITTTGDDVRVGYVGRTTSAYACYLDVAVDASRQSGNASGYTANATAGTNDISFVVVISGLSAASHTFTMQFKGDGSNVNALTSTHFWVSESG